MPGAWSGGVICQLVICPTVATASSQAASQEAEKWRRCYPREEWRVCCVIFDCFRWGWGVGGGGGELVKGGGQ